MTTPKLRIVLPGGSGHVGTSLARHFHAQGHSVTLDSGFTFTFPDWPDAVRDLVAHWKRRPQR